MEPDRAHANKCALAIMCLREYFPQDIIGLITSICWDLRSMPVYAFLSDNMSGYHDWEIVKQNISKFYPQLRPRYMNFQSISECIGGYVAGKLGCVGLLIPGYIWDTMMIEYHYTDSDIISCDSFKFEVINRENDLGIMYISICYDSLDPIPNIVQYLYPTHLTGAYIDDLSSLQINSFISIQNKVAF
jgi:hypothetical protein